MPPRRVRNVRLSVRTLVEAIDSTQGTPTKRYTHARWQRFSIWPMGPEERFKAGRAGVDASWRARARDLPEVADRSRLVSFNAVGEVDMVFTVVQVQARGGRQELWLQEGAEVQS